MSTVNVVATGDAIVTHRISANPNANFTALVDLLRSTDVTITNVEMVFPGPGRKPSTTFHGTHLGVEPELLSEFEWLGINLYGMANNHASDYGTDGLVASLEELEKRGLAYAGAGRTLREARQPRYFDAPGGRVAFISAGSSNARLSLAADPGIADAGRPGIAPVRLQKTHYIRQDRFEELREILADAGVNVTSSGTTAPGIHFPYPDRNVYDPPPPGGIAVEGVHFVPDANPRVQEDALTRDVEALQYVVDEARRQADLVIVGLHCHEGIQGRWNNEVPAEFLRPLAHGLIDAGAHGVVGHGPHMLRGVELYKGRPICYSLGNFVFNLEVISAFPPEVYEQQGMAPTSTTADLYDAVTGYADQPKFWESVVARFSYEDGVLTGTELHPITLGRTEPRSRRGCPEFASPDDAIRILEHLDELSEPFGSRVKIERTGDFYVGRITST
ncbi:CapA family protein [Rhodococcus jostii]|uniref:Poly-gamma-glutamate synthesis protein (Capsule biosynthesis protein) n=1 Tax=Rhodococcus jostii TaxID=132919 RepID=A0A1H4IVS9_RHOJO|nr:CapA family protein [Rhodococcus jostii]RZI53914.1 MAG: CapA family protein [Pseudonocardia sp.]SEB38231.1 poly-gamma-glutamate synthesis protein (capsule biosynthesis protein) [Rhodococcus jostii]